MYKNPNEKLSQDFLKIKNKYPDRIPVIIKKSNSNDPIPDKPNKYLVPKDFSVGEFLYTIRKKISLHPSKALFIFVNNTILPATSELIKTLYELYKNDDGFLYFTICSENTFG